MLSLVKYAAVVDLSIFAIGHMVLRTHCPFRHDNMLRARFGKPY